MKAQAVSLGARMAYSTYAEIPAERWSRLKKMQDGPRAYKFAVEAEEEDTDAMKLGRLIHTMTLEPELVDQEYVEWTGARRAGGEWEAFLAANPDREVVRTQDLVQARAVAFAVRSHPVAGKLLARKGEAETVVEWTDEETGIVCKCRIDYLATDRHPTIVDLKSTRRVDAWAYGSTIASLSYHGQAGYYHDGVLAKLGLDCVVKHIAVQSKPPYEVHVFKLSSDMVWAGSDLSHKLLAQLAECRATDTWPWQYVNEDEIELPKWCGDDWESEAELI